MFTFGRVFYSVVLGVDGIEIGSFRKVNYYFLNSNVPQWWLPRSVSRFWAGMPPPSPPSTEYQTFFYVWVSVHHKLIYI